MSEVQMLPLEELMAKRAGSVDPSKYPDEQFDLYSIPAFDKGSHEVVPGSEIGSTKQLVEPNDVLLSKIVPHIRRSWVVGKSNGRRMIASGEWIVFRSDKADPAYLRHVLISDPFHAQFMQTVSGVGGSLLRARPAHVAKIKIPLPHLAEQLRIAAILDQADALRAKRREALAQLDSLTQSIFIEMFGDQQKLIDGGNTEELANIVAPGRIVTYGIVQAGPEVENGVPYIRTGDIKNGVILEHQLARTSQEIAESYSRSAIATGDIVMSIRATVGTTALVPSTLDGANLTQGTARISPGARVRSVYLLNYLRATPVQRWIQSHVKGATFREITLGKLRQLPVFIPPLELQDSFVEKIRCTEQLASHACASLEELNALFVSLQHRAFHGEL